jgi:hypothetical protein
MFTYNNFNKDDFELALKNVKNKSLEELVSIMRSVLEDAYSVNWNFPANCCDFSSAFGVFIFSKLGYEAEYWSSGVKSLNGFNGDHSFLKIGGKVVDFTVDQFGILKPGLISDVDFVANYDDLWCDRARTNGTINSEFENWQDHQNNFVVMIVYQAIDSFIKLNI